jgi:hypothetical protein
MAESLLDQRAAVVTGAGQGILAAVIEVGGGRKA